jgi:hypothetical protein
VESILPKIDHEFYDPVEVQLVSRVIRQKLRFQVGINDARHINAHILIFCFLNYLVSYDVVGTMHQSLLPDQAPQPKAAALQGG